MKKFVLLLLCTTSLIFSSDILRESREYPQVHLTKELLCDLELLINGGFAPLKTFMNQEDYFSVLNTMRLSTGELWPMPITLPLSTEKAKKYQKIGHVTLIDEQSYPVAILDIDQVFAPDLEKEVLSLYGCLDDNHPKVKEILSRKNQLYLSGKLRKIAMPHHFDHTSIRLSPSEMKDFFKTNGWKKVIGFQTRNPLHKSHVALMNYCLEQAGSDAKLLIHPVVGTTQPGDIDYSLRVKCYQKLMDHFDKGLAKLSLLPLSMRMAGPKEALWHALIRKNYGCTHFIVGRDHAGPSVKKKDGTSYFGPYDAHKLLNEFKDEIGIEIISSVEIVYDKNQGKHVPISAVNNLEDIQRISGTAIRNLLKKNEPIPSWYSYPEIIELLKMAHYRTNGTCIYFVGLSGSGKSSLASALKQYLEAKQDRPVIILDGDVIRKYLSNELGFSQKDRSINVRRIGFIASLVTSSGGICICANIAPYENDRVANRELISQYGQYIEVFVDTPLEVCEKRDQKGLYKAAREEKLKNFTGVNDPFEPPIDPEITIDASGEITDSLKVLVESLNKKAPHLL